MVYAIDQRILVKTSPILLLFINTTLTAAILTPVLLLQRSTGASIGLVNGKTWLLIATTTVLGAAANVLIFSSIKVIGAPIASAFEIAYPFFVIVFDILFFSERPTSSLILGAVLIFAGAALIVMHHG
jgi:drug/metabolite transporter (DMT)-like permease